MVEVWGFVMKIETVKRHSTCWKMKHLSLCLMMVLRRSGFTTIWDKDRNKPEKGVAQMTIEIRYSQNSTLVRLANGMQRYRQQNSQPLPVNILREKKGRLPVTDRVDNTQLILQKKI